METLTRNMSLVAERMADIRQVFSEELFSLMVNEAPALLSTTADVLREKKDKLRILLPDADLNSISVAYPALYLHSFDKVIVPRIEALKEHLDSRQVQTLFEQSAKEGRPFHVLDIDLPAVLPKRMGALKELLPPGVDILSLIVEQPSIMTQDPRSLKRKLEVTAQLLGGLSDQEWAQRLNEDPRFVTVPYGVLVGRLRYLSSFMTSQELRGVCLGSLTHSNPSNLETVYKGYKAYLIAQLKEKGEHVEAYTSVSSLEAHYIRVVRQTGKTLLTTIMTPSHFVVPR